MRSRRLGIAGLAALVVIVLGLHLLAAWTMTERVETLVDDVQALERERLADEKLRGEILELQVEGQLRRFFLHSFLTGLVPLVTAFVAVLTAWVGLWKYLDARDKERLDRAAEDLRSALEQIAGAEPRGRVVGVVGLQHFFSADKREYHLRAVTALAAAARSEEDSEVRRAIRIAAEQAVRTVDPAVLVEVSWQAVSLAGVDFAARPLAAIDLRDADLEDADLSGCDLTGARLTAASLRGTRLDRAVLAGADLTHCDLAGASLRGAELRGAALHHAKVLDLDLEGADLAEANLDPGELPWDMTRNWRRAKVSPELKAALRERYGPEPSGPRVLMLMWEIAPLVAGGTWTACYHLVRNLRQRGADLRIVVPWDPSLIVSAPFGSEIEIIALGIRLPEEPFEAGNHWGSPYGRAVERTPSWSPYAHLGARWWSPGGSGPYGWTDVYGSPFGGPYGGPSDTLGGPYGRSATPGGGLYGRGTGLLRLTEELRRRLVRRVRTLDLGLEFDLVHAHDWVTFGAAEAVAAARSKPWVAHFHSTERDRRPSDPDPVLQRIEQRAVQQADALITPGEGTAGRLREDYGAPLEKISVVPNSFVAEAVPPEETGRFETRRIVFLGRLTVQKGLDRFVEVARIVRQSRWDVRFVVYGAGEEAGRYRGSQDVELRGPLSWAERGRAFRDATAVVVPSRREPFGMVVLEAMAHRVPVLYPRDSGVAEVTQAGVQLDMSDVRTVAARIEELVTDWLLWDEVVRRQSEAVETLVAAGFEARLVSRWNGLLESSVAGTGRGEGDSSLGPSMR